MSAEIINLRRARKAKARADKQQKAAENRASFGRTKGERLAEQKHEKQQSNTLDQKKLESSNTDAIKPTNPKHS
ncbi:MAG: DUF4169 family protein [Filomicrobium sp.]